MNTNLLRKDRVVESVDYVMQYLELLSSLEVPPLALTHTMIGKVINLSYKNIISAFCVCLSEWITTSCSQVATFKLLFISDLNPD